jgi:hypothetical protein
MYFKHGMSKSPEFSAWKNMLGRCLNPNVPGYHRYGGRGITVCPSWRESFATFFNDIGTRPGKGYSLEREDNSKGYEPGNVRWATRKEQQQNTRRNVYYTAFGETLCLMEWTRRTGLDGHTLAGRIKAGLPPEEVFATERRIVHGTDCHAAKLNEPAVKEIRAMIASGASNTDIARRFNVTRRAIGAIREGRAWRHVG